MQKDPPRPTTLALAIAALISFAFFLPHFDAWGVAEWLVAAGVAGLAIGAFAVARRYEPVPWPRWEAVWRHPRAPAVACLTTAAMLLIFSSFAMNRTGGSDLVRVLSMPGGVGMWIGIGIGAIGVVRLRGGRYCARCKYEMSEAIAEDPTQQQCPECGSLWKSRGGTVEGRLILRWPWIAAGVIVGAALFIGPLFAMSRPALRTAPLRVLPTGSLIEEAAMNWGISATDAWDVLMTRRLTPAQQDHLARRLLDGRRNGIMQRHADTWMQARAAAGALPPDVARRFIDEYPYPSLLSPQLVQQEQP